MYLLIFKVRYIIGVFISLSFEDVTQYRVSGFYQSNATTSESEAGFISPARMYFHVAICKQQGELGRSSVVRIYYPWI